MERLIEDLLELARHGEVIGETEPVDLDATAHDAWQQLHAPEATLLCDCDATVQADRQRLRQVFENPFGNAAEHGSASVTVTAERLPNGFVVADDGLGISPSSRETVFDRGYTTAEDGTGFGLAIVEEIIKAHDWTVRVTDSTAVVLESKSPASTSPDFPCGCPSFAIRYSDIQYTTKK